MKLIAFLGIVLITLPLAFAGKWINFTAKSWDIHGDNTQIIVSGYTFWHWAREEGEDNLYTGDEYNIVGQAYTAHKRPTWQEFDFYIPYYTINYTNEPIDMKAENITFYVGVYDITDGQPTNSKAWIQMTEATPIDDTAPHLDDYRERGGFYPPETNMTSLILDWGDLVDGVNEWKFNHTEHFNRDKSGYVTYSMRTGFDIQNVSSNNCGGCIGVPNWFAYLNATNSNDEFNPTFEIYAVLPQVI